jgi:hypothetical protein
MYLQQYIPKKERGIGFDTAPDRRRFSDLSEFVFTNMNLVLADAVRPTNPLYFTIDISLPVEVESILRVYSVKLIAMTNRGLVKDFSFRSDYSIDKSRPDDLCVLRFQYASTSSESSNAGLIIGLRNGTPWCNIIRSLSLTDFITIVEGKTTRMVRTIYKSMDKTGTQGGTGDFCRMRIGEARHNAYMVTRVRKVGGSSDSRTSQLVLEFAVQLAKGEDSYDEIGVLDCQIQLFKGSSLVKGIGDGDLVLESGQEPFRWHSAGTDMAILRR